MALGVFDELEAYSQLHEQLFLMNSSPSGRVTLDLLLSTDSDDGEVGRNLSPTCWMY
ncbi:hypothetical protein J4727_06920 [Providencia rettgeri]|uniref:Uncharacterized protein n=1 Tax=Providencia rettgeri TaxID=587 RepID=A0A939NG11_PRORE|nr:hypothetical protein [Providencia rettgeri]